MPICLNTQALSGKRTPLLTFPPNRTCPSQDMRLKHFTYNMTPCSSLVLMVYGWSYLWLSSLLADLTWFALQSAS